MGFLDGSRSWFGESRVVSAEKYIVLLDVSLED
jgi:hypothetical protein